jgi:hypothetical protein
VNLKLYYMCTNYDMDMSKRDCAFAAICALGDSGDTYSQEFLGRLCTLILVIVIRCIIAI